MSLGKGSRFATPPVVKYIQNGLVFDKEMLVVVARFTEEARGHARRRALRSPS